MAAAARILVADAVISFMWVWSGALIKLVANRALALGLLHEYVAEALKDSLAVLFLFFFAWLGVLTRGGSYNPLTVLASAMSGDFPRFVLTVLGRIPAQVYSATFPRLSISMSVSIELNCVILSHTHNYRHIERGNQTENAADYASLFPASVRCSSTDVVFLLARGMASTSGHTHNYRHIEGGNQTENAAGYASLFPASVRCSSTDVVFLLARGRRKPDRERSGLRVSLPGVRTLFFYRRRLPPRTWDGFRIRRLRVDIPPGSSSMSHRRRIPPETRPTGDAPHRVIGSIIGVWLIRETFPEVGHGPRLNVDIHRGALTEGLLTFIIVIVSLGLKMKDPKSFFMKTWISSISKLTLHILGSDLTGGCMNPASVFGWAYARGDHITKEHLFVYWLAPLEATLLGVWMFSLLGHSHKHKSLQEKEEKKKSD
ncbi:hypothetical protein Taro_044475 [Colocasia esculenta]|uniref:Aquaporin SIP2-1 n=1 Tax=Colocasia esculenta TaxID=4460 RepID=A0A843WUP1_COLES|nr:hypothetical protein [Colocasia esculenta]